VTGSFAVGVALLFLATAPIAATSRQVIYQANFAGESALDTYAWLEAMEFLLEHDAKDDDKILLSHADSALHVKVTRPAFGFIIHEQDVLGANHLRLHWGVSRYPEGASYEHGVDDEAIMIYVFFGHEKMPSGSMFVPDSPYFIGFYLCRAGTDDLEKPYVGHHYKKAGRYICVDHPGTGKKVVTEIDLVAEFRKSFGLEYVPAVSGISIEVDTTESRNDGKAAAFLERIEFLE
jgi:hypothetical protein